MEFLGRKKNRPRQSSVDGFEASVPYEQLAPSRPPIHVGTASQTLRGPASWMISAPITNPTLTSSGTEINTFAMHRSRQERDKLYGSHPAARPISPMSSPSTAESSTIYSESDESYSHHRSTTSIGETSISSGSGSTSVPEFRGHHSQGKGPNQKAAHPTTPATTQSEHITSDAPSHYRHSTYIGKASHLRNILRGEEFHFPRPDNDELELLFQEIKQSFGPGDNLPSMTVDQKWLMVYNSEHLRWAEERRREQQTEVQGSPEWYIQRFMERTITQKQVSSLGVSLRTNELSSILS